MSEEIRDGKFVELTYKVTDRKTGHVLSCVEFPLGYVHGHNEILAPSVHRELEGKSAGDVTEVRIDGNRIFGPRDESLVFTDLIENVPEEYRQVGTAILMENDRGRDAQLHRDANRRRNADGRRKQSALRQGGRLHARDSDGAQRDRRGDESRWSCGRRAEDRPVDNDAGLSGDGRRDSFLSLKS